MRLDTVEKRMEWRAAYVPKDAMKITPKGFDAVFYVYEGHKPCAMFFKGTAAKPVWRYSFRTEADRAKRIAEEIKALQDRKAFQAANGLDRMKPHGLEIGHILVTCWGYDQTNREFFKVIEVPGPRTVILQEVEGIDASNGKEGYMQGQSVPGETFKGEPIKCVANYGSVKPEGHYASLWDGKPVSWTAYH